MKKHSRPGYNMVSRFVVPLGVEVETPSAATSTR